MDGARNNIEKRNFKDLISTLDKELAKEAGETAVAKMNMWSNFARRNAEALRQMWQRYDRLLLSMQKSDIILQKKIAFRKILTAMKLSGSQLSILLGTIESRADGEDNINELKRLSIKLFEHHFMEADERILAMSETAVTGEKNAMGAAENRVEVIDSLSNEKGSF